MEEQKPLVDLYGKKYKNKEPSFEGFFSIFIDIICKNEITIKRSTKVTEDSWYIKY
jgi:hypothetical protein